MNEYWKGCMNISFFFAPLCRFSFPFAFLDFQAICKWCVGTQPAHHQWTPKQGGSQQGEEEDLAHKRDPQFTRKQSVIHTLHTKYHLNCHLTSSANMVLANSSEGYHSTLSFSPYLDMAFEKRGKRRGNMLTINGLLDMPGPAMGCPKGVMEGLFCP